MASKDLERFLALLPTSEAASGIKLFDDLVKDPANAGPILQELLLVASNHEDPQLHTPHGLLTVRAARDALLLTRPPRGIGLLRFLVLYTFSMPKRKLTPEAAAAVARAVPAGSRDELGQAYVKAVHGGLGAQAAALVGRLALDHGLEAAAHLVVRASLGDIGRLGHNLSAAAGYAEAAMVLGRPKGLVPLANLAHLQAVLLPGTKEAEIPALGEGRDGEPDVDRLAELVEAWEFDRVEAVLRALAFEGQADVAYGPLLVAASADPGFLGHTLSLVHDARVASRHLTPAENAWLLWKLYRTLTTRFGYPEFLRLGPPGALDRESVLEALDSSLRHKTPPAETTLRQVLESGVPLEDLLARIVDAYGAWTVGEKDHTISYLNAALQTARFLGKDEALLPLAIALGKLPF